jgi:hypothetical protein
MRRRIIAIVMATVPLATPAQAQSPGSKPTPVTPRPSSAFLCTETSSAGVRYNKDFAQWEGGPFETLGKFTVHIDLVRQRTVFGKPGERPIAVGGDYRVTMTLPAPDAPKPERRTCVAQGGEADLVAIVGDGHLTCRVLSYDLTLNFETGRFLLINRAGFVDGRDAGGNAPSVSIGHCIRTGP